MDCRHYVAAKLSLVAISRLGQKMRSESNSVVWRRLSALSLSLSSSFVFVVGAHVIDHLVAVGAAVTARETVGSEGVDARSRQCRCDSEGAGVSVVTVGASGTNKQKPPVVPWGGLYRYTI
jgi:hypothetical protein